jgi:hypothetical protein
VEDVKLIDTLNGDVSIVDFPSKLSGGWVVIVSSAIASAGVR